MQLILGLVLAAFLYVVLTQWARLPPERKKAMGWKIGVGLFIGLLVLMVITGRVNILVAGVAALLPVLRKLPGLIRYIPALKRFHGWYQDSSAGSGADAGNGSEQHNRPVGSGDMAIAEACDILGVTADCSAADVIAAHRKLIQKLHPDRGGNDYLAAKVNEAKSVLLKRQS